MKIQDGEVFNPDALLITLKQCAPVYKHVGDVLDALGRTVGGKTPQLLLIGVVLAGHQDTRAIGHRMNVYLRCMYRSSVSRDLLEAMLAEVMSAQDKYCEVLKGELKQHSEELEALHKTLRDNAVKL